MSKNNFSDLIREVQNHAKEARGPDRYVVRSFVPLIQSNEAVVDANEKIRIAIERFEKSTNRTELIMIFLALAQLVLALATWKAW